MTATRPLPRVATTSEIEQARHKKFSNTIASITSELTLNANDSAAACCRNAYNCAASAVASLKQTRGYGNLAELTVLIEEWFPDEQIEVIETGREKVQTIPAQGLVPAQFEETYMKFNLTLTYGQGKNTTCYVKSFNYRDVSEAKIGEAIGIVRCAHAMRTCLDDQINVLEILAEKNGSRYNQAASSIRDAFRKVPLMGWSVVSPEDAAFRSCKFCGRPDVSTDEDGQLLPHDDNEDHSCHPQCHVCGIKFPRTNCSIVPFHNPGSNEPGCLDGVPVCEGSPKSTKNGY